MISVTALSNTILRKSFSEAIPVSPMKLQKLLYFIYRDYLKEYDKPLFSEHFLAWKYGPVLRSAYDEFKSFKDKPICRFAKDAQDNVFVIDEEKSPELSAIVDQVWGRFKCYDGISLSNLTHLPGTAWSKAIEQKLECLRDEDIKNEQGS